MKALAFVVQLLGYLLLTLLAEAHANEPMVFTHRVPEAYVSSTPNYEESVLKLALDKTIAEYGPYEFKAGPQINVSRSIQSIKANDFPNYFASLGYKEDYNASKEISYVRFPVNLGILSYRTCFAASDNLDKISKVDSLDELRKLSMGQARGWVDTSILRQNGFNVIEIEPYTILFKMVAAHRFDLFCRGANEIKEEYERWGNIEGLAYDKHLLIYYPMPIFFYTNSQNKTAIARVTKGLHKAYADGSLMTLWRAQHQASIDFAQLNERKIFRLENPLAKTIDFDYTKYFYQLRVNQTHH
jgi:hypothetical protein